MITRQGVELKPVPFSEFIDPVSGRTRIRLVDTASPHYRIAREYQIRLAKSDLENQQFIERLTEITRASPDQLRAEFSDVAFRWGELTP